MRNPALGLMLAAALFGATPHFPLVAAPCIISIFIQVRRAPGIAASSHRTGLACRVRGPTCRSLMTIDLRGELHFRLLRAML